MDEFLAYFFILLVANLIGGFGYNLWHNRHNIKRNFQIKAEERRKEEEARIVREEIKRQAEENQSEDWGQMQMDSLTEKAKETPARE